MTLALLLFAALQASPASVAVPQLSETQRGGAGAVVTDNASLAAGATRPRGDLASAPTQVGEGGRTAESAPALSTRAQGRSVSAAAVGGRDRCDPAAPGADSDLCRRRVETRAGEFSAPTSAPVTAEGRLLLLSEPQSGPQTVESATRRLGSAQGVDALAGPAASNTLAGAIASTRPDTPSSQAAAAAAATAALPSGVPSTVVLTPR